jgi:asparagine synthase (glutamine-hydrolysing)
MCGVAGVMWWTRERAEGSAAAASRMGRRLAHRGPDGQGQWTSGLEAPAGVALAHTRLAIIDLTGAASQPMVRGRTVIAYNGEIYNFGQIRQDL